MSEGVNPLQAVYSESRRALRVEFDAWLAARPLPGRPGKPEEAREGALVDGDGGDSHDA